MGEYSSQLQFPDRRNKVRRLKLSRKDRTVLQQLAHLGVYAITLGRCNLASSDFPFLIVDLDDFRRHCLAI